MIVIDPLEIKINKLINFVNFGIFFFDPSQHYIFLYIFVLMKKSLILSILILFTSCAVIQAPSGGPPDKEPPRIIDSSPANYTKNFAGKSIDLEFSEYLNRSDVVKSIRINPPIKFDYSWSGRGLEIEFIENLKENTTYSFQLGTGFTDLSGNNPASSLEIVFSTGNDLDSLQIKGNLEAEKPEGLLVYLWDLNSEKVDTLDFTTDPDYITELGSNGDFSFGALKNNEYRLLVFEDKNQNKTYDVGFEKFAVPQYDPVAKEKADNLKMRLSEANDISGPTLLYAFASSYESVDLSFSENITLESFDISLSDSASGESFLVRSSYFLDSISGKKIRAITGKLPPDRAIKAEVFAKDTTGKEIIDSTKIKFIYAPDRDLKKDDKIEYIGVKDSSNINSVFFEYLIKFPYPPREENFDIIELYKLEDSTKIELNRDILDPRTFRFYNSELAEESDYKLKVKINSISGIFNDNFPDTTFNISFKTGKKAVCNSISGTFADSSLSKNPYILLRIYNQKSEYYAKIDGNNWKVDKILAGNYNAEIIFDENQNGKLDLGSVKPYSYSEKFQKLSNQIEIKERWDLEDIILSE